jgi:hypothetical protein
MYEQIESEGFFLAPTAMVDLANSSNSPHDGNERGVIRSDLLNGETVEGEGNSSSAKKATDAYESINNYGSSSDDDND